MTTQNTPPPSQPEAPHAVSPKRLTPTILMTHDDWANFDLIKARLTKQLRAIDPAAKEPSDPKVLTYALRHAATYIEQLIAEKEATSNQ